MSRSGRRRSSTRFGPKARTASAAQTPESMPPDVATTAPRRPSLRSVADPVAMLSAAASRSRARGSVAVASVTLPPYPRPDATGTLRPGRWPGPAPIHSDRCVWGLTPSVHARRPWRPARAPVPPGSRTPGVWPARLGGPGHPGSGPHGSGLGHPGSGPHGSGLTPGARAWHRGARYGREASGMSEHHLLVAGSAMSSKRKSAWTLMAQTRIGKRMSTLGTGPRTRGLARAVRARPALCACGPDPRCACGQTRVVRAARPALCQTRVVPRPALCRVVQRGAV